MEHEVKFARLGDDRIAYFSHGDGPVPIVNTSGSFGHVDIWWDDASNARYRRRLGTFARLIQFDRRGSGASDPLPPEAVSGWESYTADIRAVMDAEKLERAVIAGFLDGAQTAMMFAATDPDRVSSLVLGHTTAKFIRSEDYPCGHSREETDALHEAICRMWGTEEFSRFNHPSRVHDEQFMKWYARYQRAALSPQAAAVFWRHLFEVDIREVLPAIRAPTLIIHRTGYQLIPFCHAEYLAEHIPDATLAPMPGEGGILGEDLEDVATHIEKFVVGSTAPQEADRVLATVLFTDVVGSTNRIAEIGDSRWKELLEAHDRISRHHIDVYRGKMISHTGDGMLATFDGPGRAIRCARALQGALHAIDVGIRAGIHTGEIEILSENIGGLAVHIAARICSLADAGETLVSSTVRDLVAGSSIEFADRGAHPLKGVPEPWRLFAVTRC